MKRTLIGGAVLIAFFGGTTLIKSIEQEPIVYIRTAEAKEVEVQIEAVIDWTPARIDQEIVTQAKAYGVSAEVMRKVIACESMGSTTIQSYHRRPDGTREQSFGLVQIHLPDWPEVTRDQAIDPKFAIDFLASHLAEGQGNLWSCYRMQH